MTKTLTCLLAAFAFVGIADGAPQMASFGGPYLLGSSIYTARDFAPEIAVHVGQPTSAEMLDSLRAAIQARYIRDGYVTPIIAIPSEDLHSTNPRLMVHEARISGVEIRGDAGPYRSQIDSLARTVQRSFPLRKELLRTVIYRISHLPGITSRPLIDPRPGSTNDFLLVLRVQYKAIAGRVELNNGGTRGLGRELLAVDLDANDLLGLQERMHLSGVVSSHPDRYQYEEVDLQRSFSSTTAFASVSGSKANPDQNIYFRNTHFAVGLTQQWQFSADRSASLGASFIGDNGSVRDSAMVPWLDDRERSITLGVTLAKGGEARPGRLYLGIERGLEIAGSAINEGPLTEADARYLKYVVDAQEIVAIGDSWSFQVNFNGQATSAIVPVLDRFTFGGIGFGAAFDPGTISGDSGAELSLQIARVVRLNRWGVRYARLYLRSDTGVMWNNSNYFYHREQASSAGGGVFARWTHFTTTFELSTPLDQPSYVSAQSLRSYGSVAYVF